MGIFLTRSGEASGILCLRMLFSHDPLSCSQGFEHTIVKMLAHFHDFQVQQRYAEQLED